MRIETVQTFYGRPDETTEEFSLFAEPDQVDVPDEFGRMVIDKGLAKLAGSRAPAKKEAVNEAE